MSSDVRRIACHLSNSPATSKTDTRRAPPPSPSAGALACSGHPSDARLLELRCLASACTRVTQSFRKISTSTMNGFLANLCNSLLSHTTYGSRRRRQGWGEGMPVWSKSCTDAETCTHTDTHIGISVSAPPPPHLLLHCSSKYKRVHSRAPCTPVLSS